MATDSDLMTIARNQSFQDRVKYEMQKVALYVMIEDALTVAHAIRVPYAKSILAGTSSVFEVAVGAVNDINIAAEGSLQLPDFGISDAHIAVAVNSIFNAFAGKSN